MRIKITKTIITFLIAVILAVAAACNNGVGGGGGGSGRGDSGSSGNSDGSGGGSGSGSSGSGGSSGGGNYGSGTGTISISAPGGSGIIGSLIYEITISGNGQTFLRTVNAGGTIKENVSVGPWTVSATAFNQGAVYATGSVSVVVQAGKTSPADLKMNIVYNDPTCTHNFQLTSTIAPTCTASGYDIYTCSICSVTENRNIVSELGHTPGTAATCTAPQVCTVCADVLEPATGHTPGPAATCTTAQTCAICSAVITPALGHDFTGGWKYDADDHWKECERCGTEESGSRAAHTFSGGMCTTCNALSGTYTVTVHGGSGSGAYAAGVPVPITAGTAPIAMQFKDWAITPAVTFTSGNAAASSATFTMPASAVTVTANFEGVSVYTFTGTVTSALLQTVVNNIADGGTIILPAGSHSMASTVNVSKEVTITTAPGANVTFTRPLPREHNSFNVGSGGKLILDPGAGGSLTVTGGQWGGGSEYPVAVIRVSNGGELEINNGVTITDTYVNGSASIMITGVGSKFTMNGGIITGITRSGPVGIENGASFHMSGGQITGNANANGTTRAVVFISGAGSSFVMSGTAEISNNYLNPNPGVNGGGGVRVTAGASFTMLGGTIKGNYVQRADRYGGGVFIHDGGSFTKTGGIIYGRDAGSPDWNRITNAPGANTYPGQGWAVYVAGPTVRFRDNTANAGVNLDSSTAANWE